MNNNSQQTKKSLKFIGFYLLTTAAILLFNFITTYAFFTIALGLVVKSWLAYIVLTIVHFALAILGARSATYFANEFITKDPFGLHNKNNEPPDDSTGPFRPA